MSGFEVGDEVILTEFGHTLRATVIGICEAQILLGWKEKPSAEIGWLIADEFGPDLYEFKQHPNIGEFEYGWYFFLPVSDNEVQRLEHVSRKIDPVFDGMACCRCGEWYPMAAPNQPDGKMKCYCCRTNPYR